MVKQFFTVSETRCHKLNGANSTSRPSCGVVGGLLSPPGCSPHWHGSVGSAPPPPRPWGGPVSSLTRRVGLRERLQPAAVGLSVPAGCHRGLAPGLRGCPQALALEPASEDGVTPSLRVFPDSTPICLSESGFRQPLPLLSPVWFPWTHSGDLGRLPCCKVCHLGCICRVSLPCKWPLTGSRDEGSLEGHYFARHTWLSCFSFVSESSQNCL